MKKIFIFLTFFLLFKSTIFAQANYNITKDNLNLFFNTPNISFISNTSNSASKNEIFQLNIITDSILLSTGTVLNGIWFVHDYILDKDKPSQNFTPDSIDSINKFDRNFAKPYSKSLDITSDITLALTICTPLIFLNQNNEEKIKIFSMYAETLLLTNGIKEIGKISFSRLRPYTYFSNFPQEFFESGDFNKSFPSGHSAFAFASATFVSYVYSKYYPDSNWKYLVIGSSYSLAVTTQILRVESGSHFLSDVLTGAAIGTLCGFLVPWLHTINVKTKNLVTVTPTSISFSVKF